MTTARGIARARIIIRASLSGGPSPDGIERTGGHGGGLIGHLVMVAVCCINMHRLEVHSTRPESPAKVHAAGLLNVLQFFGSAITCLCEHSPLLNGWGASSRGSETISQKCLSVMGLYTSQQS